MSNLVIAALPSEDDYVNQISSEKAAHMTLLFLGDAVSNPNVIKIIEFVEHATEVWERGPFMLDVDHRGTLGEDKADVLFFRDKGWTFNQIETFRGWLLQNDAIRRAYENAPQYAEWTPHLTLGYPETPANEDKRDYPGIQWVRFDRIAVWFGDYEGPEFRLEYNYDLEEVGMSVERGAEFISHYGVLGMRWGVRKDRNVSTSVRTDTGLIRRKTQVRTKGGESQPAHTDAVVAAVQKQKLKKSGTDALSTQELRELATRLQLEQQVKVLSSSKGQKFVKRQIEAEGEQAVRRTIRRGAAAAGKTAFKVAV